MINTHSIGWAKATAKLWVREGGRMCLASGLYSCRLRAEGNVIYLRDTLTIPARASGTDGEVHFYVRGVFAISMPIPGKVMAGVTDAIVRTPKENCT